ncbi:MAG TPA: aldehyde dehydrogenase (NADP(+)) [Opitutus sp.]|nr:aldehyde dehydrogenase (NADP(+)) [Opitutus sp.]
MNYTAHNPATSEPLSPTYTDATLSEINEVAQSVANVADLFANSSAETRAVLLETIADEIMARSAALIERANLETGLPIPRLEGERNRTMGQLRSFAALLREGSWVDARIDPALPDRKPIPRPDLRRMLRAIGPVAVFGASNFPFAYSVAGGDTASALAAGNPVIVKAHPAHPGTSDITAEAIRAALVKVGLPAGIFGMVHGTSPEVSLALVKHPAMAAVGFTGSTRAGRALFDAAAARPLPIPVFAEMSSVNPVIILPQALAERGDAIAEGYVASATLGVGQFCTKPGLVFGIAGPAWEKFAATVGARAAGVGPAVMLHSGIRASYERGVSELRDVEWLNRGSANFARVDAKDFRTRPELAHELFGPFGLLITARDFTELQSLLEPLEGQLTAAVHGTPAELASATDLMTLLTRKAGRLICNAFPTGVEVSPAMNHGGPYPATTDVRFTAVGTGAILRFARPVCYQSFPAELLPPALQNSNPLGILRQIDGQHTRDPLGSTS